MVDSKLPQHRVGVHDNLAFVKRFEEARVAGGGVDGELAFA